MKKETIYAIAAGFFGYFIVSIILAMIGIQSMVLSMVIVTAIIVAFMLVLEKRKHKEDE